MKPNFVGIIGGIFAFVSLALPWWTLMLSAAGYSVDVSVYPYRVLAAGVTIEMDVWYGWTALALVVIGGILGILGGVMEYGKKLLVGGGVLALLSVIVFAVGVTDGASTAIYCRDNRSGFVLKRFLHYV